MWLGLDWYVQRFLERLGLSESQAITKTRKMYNLESWLRRKHTSSIIIQYDPKDCLNKWTEMTSSIDNFRLEGVKGHWKKHFIWVGKAYPTNRQS